jgi:hypothetical protein
VQVAKMPVTIPADTIQGASKLLADNLNIAVGELRRLFLGTLFLGTLFLSCLVTHPLWCFYTLNIDKFFLTIRLLFRYYRGDERAVLTISVADPDPGSGVFLTPRSGIREEHTKSYFRELRNIFSVGQKILKFFDADPESFWSGIRDGKIWIRDPV